jgi:glycine/D-amino acid oxidase-like deaminating enzyme
MKNAKRTIIIGAGVKGSSLAALLSACGDHEVTLIDRSNIGSGATCTNHGRLHLGTANWRKEPVTRMARRLKGSETWRFLPGALECENSALYCFETEEAGDAFEERCERARLCIRPATKETVRSVRGWIKPSEFPRMYEVPEFSFSPARLAGRLAHFAERNGARVLADHVVTDVDANSRSVRVKLASGQVETGDCVINMSAKWASTIRLKQSAETVDVNWYQWPILCLRARAFPPLPRVVVIDAEGKSPTVIPHRDFITLDAKGAPPQQVHSPDATAHEAWRKLNLKRQPEGQIVETARQHFPAFAKLSPAELQEHAYSFVGIQGRKRHNNPLKLTGGSKSDVYTVPLYDRFLVVLGGQASTALLDANEVIDYMWQRGLCERSSRQELITRVAAGLPPDPHPMSVEMIWETTEGVTA